MKKKLTVNQVRLLICLVIVAIFSLSYQFIYLQFEKQAENYQIKSEETKQMIVQRNEDLANEDSMTEQTKEMNTQIDTIIDHYPVKITKEDDLIFIEEMEKELGIDIPSVSVLDSAVFYTTILPIRAAEGEEPSDLVPAADSAEGATEANADAATVTGEGTVTEAADATATADAGTSADAANVISDQFMTGVTSSISISFQITEKQFRKLVDYINEYPERTSIASTSLSYDSSTGELVGSMTINRYALTGSGKVYEEPYIGDISIGTDNIFGKPYEAENQNNEAAENQDSIATE